MDAMKETTTATRGRTPARVDRFREDTMTKITDKERALLVAIRDSEYQDGDGREHVVGHPVWAEYVCEGFGTSAGGVMASLVKKGLVTHEEYDPGMPTVALTAEGFDAVAAVPGSMDDEPRATSIPATREARGDCPVEGCPGTKDDPADDCNDPIGCGLVHRANRTVDGPVSSEALGEYLRRRDAIRAELDDLLDRLPVVPRDGVDADLLDALARTERDVRRCRKRFTR